MIVAQFVKFSPTGISLPMISDVLSNLSKKYAMNNVPKKIITTKLGPPNTSLRPIYRVNVNAVGDSFLEELQRELRRESSERDKLITSEILLLLEKLRNQIIEGREEQVKSLLRKTIDNVFQSSESQALQKIVDATYIELHQEIDYFEILCSEQSRVLLKDLENRHADNLEVQVRSDIPFGEFHIVTGNGSLIIDIEKIKSAILQEL